MIRTLKEALAFVRRHGAVSMTRSGELPCFVDAVAGGPVKGSWWGHPKGEVIFNLLNQLLDSGEVDAFPLIDGKRTFLHRSLMPAFYRVVSDPGRRRSKTRSLNALERRLLEAVAKAGTLRMDPWALRNDVDSKALKKAKTRLTDELLLKSDNVHTDTGNHASVLVDWSRWASAEVRRAAKSLTLEESRETIQAVCGGRVSTI
ncbi:MAG TPA: hypothetical protein VNM14_23210 [Planctomycetota bacterium]|jgi:hypothetical protein|nr:hypothetical protein [Planctomycetota bacterium]